MGDRTTTQAKESDIDLAVPVAEIYDVSAAGIWLATEESTSTDDDLPFDISIAVQYVRAKDRNFRYQLHTFRFQPENESKNRTQGGPQYGAED